MGSGGVFERVGAGMGVKVVFTDTFMQNGAGATCRSDWKAFRSLLYFITRQCP